MGSYVYINDYFLAFVRNSVCTLLITSTDEFLYLTLTYKQLVTYMKPLTVTKTYQTNVFRKVSSNLVIVICCTINYEWGEYKIHHTDYFS